MALIEFLEKGMYCPAGDFFIDPWKPVDRAVITHGHSDHARWGSRHYLCQADTTPILETRLGPGQYQGVDWKANTYINGVRVSFHPAGHVIGSAQVRVEYNGEVWVVSGDYKLENDGLSGQFEPVKCHTFITESTFGLPIYKWKKQNEIYRCMKDWVVENQKNGRSSIFFAYSLGKAQRILLPLAEITDTILAHGAVYNMYTALVQAGWKLPTMERVTPDTPKEKLKNAVVIAPGSAEGTPWIRKFSPYAVGVCSGWMQVRGNVRRRNADAGFALSDHADWDGLIQTVKATQAECVYVTHGFQAVFSRYLTEMGIDGREIHTEFGAEEDASAELPEGP